MSALEIKSARGTMRRHNSLCANRCTKSGTFRVTLCGYPLDPTNGYFCASCVKEMRQIWHGAAGIWEGGDAECGE